MKDMHVCPEGTDSGICSGKDLGIAAKFSVTGLFSGSVQLKVSPKIAINNITVDSSEGLISSLNLFTDGVVSFDLPPRELAPLVVSGNIKLSNAFDVIPLPDLLFSWSSATGKIAIAFPTTIAIDTDIPIPPWLNISQIKIPVGKTQDGTVTMGMKMTLGEHYVQYVFNIDGTWQANPKKRKVKIVGKASLLTLPLYQVTGDIDFDKKEMVSKSETIGVLKAIVPQEDILRILGEQCLVTQRDKVSFLFFNSVGELVIQIPPKRCGTILSSAASNCGLSGDGGICISADVAAGKLGKGAGHIRTGFDLTNPNFSAGVKTDIEVIRVGVKLDLEADEQELGIKAKVHIAGTGLKFGFIISKPSEQSDVSAREILEHIIDLLKNPHIDLSKPISISASSGSDHGQVTVEADDGKDPKMSKFEKGSGSNQVNENGALPNQGTDQYQQAPAPPNQNVAQKQQVPAQKDQGPDQTQQALTNPNQGAAQNQQVPAQANNAQAVATKGVPQNEVKSLFAGPIMLSFDAAKRYIVETDSISGKVEIQSEKPVDAQALEILRGSCPVDYFSQDYFGNGRTRASQADGWVLWAGPSCSVPQGCSPGQFCALGLYNGGSNAGPIDLNNKMSWTSATDLQGNPSKANELERGILRAYARTKLFPSEDQKSRIFLDAMWQCIVPMKEGAGCRSAVEKKPDGAHPAFIASDGGIYALEDKSLLRWAADVSNAEIQAKLYSEQIEGSLVGYGNGDLGWLVSELGEGNGTTLAVFNKSGSPMIPVAVSQHPALSTRRLWTDFSETNGDLASSANIVSANNSGENTDWLLVALVNAEGGRRVLLASTSRLWLITPAQDRKVCVREQSRATVFSRKEFELVKDLANDDVGRLADALELSSKGWRDRGFRVNPVLGFFGNQCSN